jgi:competence ComEA-like helix-hairpin-helix protein
MQHRAEFHRPRAFKSPLDETTKSQPISFMKIFASLVCLVFLAASPARAESPLKKFTDCEFVSSSWADGDSFPVRLPDGREITARLYGADCIEAHVNNESDARRLRAQRRYFGIGGGEAPESIALARDLGRKASKRTAELLAKPFTVHTVFSDARGSGTSQRVYVFITTSNNRDLASVLVEEGLARAFGVARSTPQGLTGNDYREQLRDLELVAAASRQGIWASTDWKHLAEDRANERREAAEIAQILRPSIPEGGIDVNSATADQLVALEGVGPNLAGKIIQTREVAPFQSLEDMGRVKGLGPGVMKKIASSVRFGPSAQTAKP